MSEELEEESLCSTCKYGLGLSGKMIQRATSFDADIEFEEEEDDEEDEDEEDNPFNLPSWMREEEDLPEDISIEELETQLGGLVDEIDTSKLQEEPTKKLSMPEVKISHVFTPMYHNQCFFPWEPTNSSKQSEGIELPDCVITKCNRYSKLEV